MGYGKWSDDTYSSISSNYKTKTTDQIFTAKSLDNLLSPKDIDFRESRDSDEHPNSLATVIFVDVTGSMGMIPDDLVRHKLGTLMTTMIDHGVPDAQILFGAIGDHYTDKAPLQVAEFESETTKINDALTKVYLEGNGGGQQKESYLLAWLFAARHTSTDCFEKRGQKGVLFTIGDEGVHEELSTTAIAGIFGSDSKEGISAEQLLNEAKGKYHVFHMHVNQGSYPNNPTIINQWKGLLGEGLIIVDDYTLLPELMASTVAVINGANLKTVAASFNNAKIGDTVSTALIHLENGLSQTKDAVYSL